MFTSRQSVNIPDAFADLRFNPAFDRRTGFFTRSIVCAPVVNKAGKVIGVTMNEAAERILGRPAANVVGEPMAAAFRDVCGPLPRLRGRPAG